MYLVPRDFFVLVPVTSDFSAPVTVFRTYCYCYPKAGSGDLDDSVHTETTYICVLFHTSAALGGRSGEN